MPVEVYMPKMSDHMEAGEIVRWLAKEGEQVEEHQPILEVMTDKVVAVFDAPASGILKGIRVGAQEGARVPVGVTIAFVAAPDEEVPVLPPLSASAAGAPAAGRRSAAAAPTAMVAEPGQVRAAPAARALARELGVDLARVTGSGPEGRITVGDVRAFHAAQEAAGQLGVDLMQAVGSEPGGRVAREEVQATAGAVAPAVPAEEEVEWLDLAPAQRITGQRLVESSHAAPHFALTVSADMGHALALRQAVAEQITAEVGEPPSITAILVRVAADALRMHPRANASFEHGRVRLHKRVNVGIAMGSEGGLVVPVIRDADRKSLAEIGRELEGFRLKAAEMRFSSEDLSGGTFTISNLGMYGIERFTAIINPPESAILAVGRIAKTPVAMPDDTIALRPLMSLTLTVDHRSLDGVQAAQFLAEVKTRLEQPCLLL